MDVALQDKRRNDDGMRSLVLDISKIILALVGQRNPTTEQEKVVADVLRFSFTPNQFSI